MRKFITHALLLVCCLLYFSSATARLYWQPSRLQHHNQELRLLFQTQPVKPGIRQAGSEKAPLAPLVITGRAGQVLTVCSQQVRADDGSILLTEPDQIGTTPHRLMLSHWQTTLHIEKPHPCPTDDIHPLPYDYQGILYSAEPFLVTSQKEPDNRRETQGGSSLSADLSKPSPPGLLLTGGGGGGLGPDNDNPFKHPFQPPFADQSDITLTLLPFLRLPPDWRNQLPGSQWFHWLFGVPDYDAGAVMNIQVNGESVARLSLHPRELRELAEDLSNSRQLLQKLACPAQWPGSLYPATAGYTGFRRAEFYG